MPSINFGDSLYHITGRPENEDEIAFDVYETYLKNFVSLIKTQFSTFESFVDYLMPKVKHLQVDKNLDLDYIRRFLFIGWNTEYLAKINDKSTNMELMRVNNQWKPIQVYYSVYSIGEAVCYAVKGHAADGHRKCLRLLSDFLITTDIKPWNLGFKGYLGNNKTVRTIKAMNFPADVSIPSDLQRNNLDPIQSIACCLQAEHKKRIKEYERGKKGVYKYLYDPGNTSLLHFLYRLRIKSNYKDVEIFLSEAPENQIKSFSLNLTNINLTTNILFEVLIMKKVGKSVFIRLINEFIKKNTDASFLTDRKDKYIKFVN